MIVIAHMAFGQMSYKKKKKGWNFRDLKDWNFSFNLVNECLHFHNKENRIAVLTMSTGPPARDQSDFIQTSKFFSFYLKLY